MRIIKRNVKEKDCAVVAAFNAASWCRAYKPYKEVEAIAKSCGYNPNRGMYHFQFANLIKKLDLPVKKVNPKRSSIEGIESSIYLGKFFVFLYTLTGDHCGHAISVFTDHTGRIRIINTDKERITWDEFAAEINANGMRNLSIYEFPIRAKSP